MLCKTDILYLENLLKVTYCLLANIQFLSRVVAQYLLPMPVFLEIPSILNRWVIKGFANDGVVK